MLICEKIFDQEVYQLIKRKLIYNDQCYCSFWESSSHITDFVTLFSKCFKLLKVLLQNLQGFTIRVFIRYEVLYITMLWEFCSLKLKNPSVKTKLNLNQQTHHNSPQLCHLQQQRVLKWSTVMLGISSLGCFKHNKLTHV